MIAEADIAQTLQQHLAGMTDVPAIAYENKDLPFGTARPYLVAEIVRVSRVDRTLNGGQVESRGFLQVTVVDLADQWAFPAERLADDISERFAYPQSLAVTGGKVTITKPPAIQQGYRDGPNWRLPVRIDYLAT